MSQDCTKGTDPEDDSIAFAGSTSLMGLSHVAISDNVSTRYKNARKGTKGITSHGRNQIRAGCHWLEERFGKRNLTFLTATLPDAAMRACTPDTWSEVVNRFLKSLRYHLINAGLCPEIVGCVEIQEKRLLTTDGIPPLHLHLLFQGKQQYHHWGIDKEEFRRLWGQACRSVWTIEAEFSASCRAESIYRSGVAYMSKYLSKGGDVLTKCNPDLLPSAWYTLSAKLKGIIKATILHGQSHLAMQLYEYICNGELLKWSHQIYSPEHANGSRYLIAFVGQIAKRGKFWEIKGELEKLIYRNTEERLNQYEFSF